MNQSIIPLIVACVGISGTVVGIAIGHFLVRDWDRRKWLLDRRNEEFKELMTVIATAYAKCGDPRYHFHELTVESLMEMNAASTNCLVTIQNRIYIAEHIKHLRLDYMWLNAFESLVKEKNPEKYGAAVRKMMDSIVAIAREHYQ
jgi:hypothetical protein